MTNPLSPTCKVSEKDEEEKVTRTKLAQNLIKIRYTFCVRPVSWKMQMLFGNELITRSEFNNPSPSPFSVKWLNSHFMFRICLVV